MSLAVMCSGTQSMIHMSEKQHLKKGNPKCEPQLVAVLSGTQVDEFSSCNRMRRSWVTSSTLGLMMYWTMAWAEGMVVCTSSVMKSLFDQIRENLVLSLLTVMSTMF